MQRILAGAIFWIAVASIAIAQAAIIRSVLRVDRGVADQPLRRASELAWAIVPGIALVALLLFTWRAMHPMASRVSGQTSVASMSRS